MAQGVPLIVESREPVFASDARGVIVAWNPACEALTGVPAAAACGIPWMSLITSAGVLRGAHPRRLHPTSVVVHAPGMLVEIHLLAPDPEPSQQTARPALTPRQREVLALVAAGLPARRIASELVLSEATVRNHIRALLRTLGAHSQLEAVATARRCGLC
jgi:DNA-binding CsgD family transcriptional regulator